MNAGIIFFIVIVVLVVLALKIKQMKKARLGMIPYERVENFLSPAEFNFMKHLDQIEKDRFHVFSKVRLADIVSVKSKKDTPSAFNRIQSKHVDFLICDKLKNYEILAAIELDDSSHNRQNRKDRDQFLNTLFESINTPLIRFKVQSAYNTGKIEEHLKSLMNH